MKLPNTRIVFSDLKESYLLLVRIKKPVGSLRKNQIVVCFGAKSKRSKYGISYPYLYVDSPNGIILIDKKNCQKLK